MAATGTAILDFGAYPGKLDAKIAVTGQAAILAGSRVEAWIDTGTATAAHSTDEHIMASAMLAVTYGTIVAATGFTIYGLALDAAPSGAGGLDGNFRTVPRKISRLYGTFTIAWAWV
jgi:hypothetical protein